MDLIWIKVLGNCRPDQTAVQVLALLKRSCLRTGKGPRHLYVTMCG